MFVISVCVMGGLADGTYRYVGNNRGGKHDQKEQRIKELGAEGGIVVGEFHGAYLLV